MLLKFGGTSQPAAQDISAPIQWHVGKHTKLKTVLFGCQINITSESKWPAVLLAEGLLALIESFFSTAIEHTELPIAGAQEVFVSVQVGDAGDAAMFSVATSEDECGETWVEVVVQESFPSSMFTATNANDEAPYKFLGALLEQLYLPHLDKEWLEKLFKDERSPDRSSVAFSAAGRITNLLGTEPAYCPPWWVNEFSDDSLECLRTSNWNDGRMLNPEPGDGAQDERNHESFGFDGARHRDIQTRSPIRPAIWDRAGWAAVGVAGFESGPPMLLLGFKDVEAGQKIFRGWRKLLGKDDEQNFIGVWIITGIDRDNPAHYRVVISIGDEYPKEVGSETRLHGMTSRIHTMTPESTKNLDLFRTERTRWGGLFALAPIEVIDNQLSPKSLTTDLAVLKRHVAFIPAWEVGQNSIASIGIRATDNPIIPEGIEDAPVMEVLKSRAKRDDNAQVS